MPHPCAIQLGQVNLNRALALLGNIEFNDPPDTIPWYGRVLTNAKHWKLLTLYYNDNVVTQAVVIAKTRKLISLQAPLDYPVCFGPEVSLVWLPLRTLSRRETFTYFCRAMSKDGKCVWNSPSNDTSLLDAVVSEVTLRPGETLPDACRRLQAAYDTAVEAPEVINTIKAEYLALLKRVRELET